MDGDDINIDDFISDIENLTDENLINLRELALAENTIVNFILSKSARVAFVNISLDMPDGMGFDDPINFS